MKGYDIFIVRMLPFMLYIQVGICSFMALNGYEIDDFYLLHSNSAIYALSLFFISLANKKYHCHWNRAMYIFLIAVPVFNYLDSKLNFVSSVSTYILLFHIAYGLTAIITAYYAIRHFYKVTKLRQKLKDRTI
jgi:hypothetical protein